VATATGPFSGPVRRVARTVRRHWSKV